MLTLTHTHAEGTQLDGTSRGDGTAEVLRTRPGGAYWKWSRNLGAWFIVHSRDHLPNRHRIAATAEALRAAGFEVTTDVDDASRPTAEVVEERRERAADRAEHFEAKAERRHAEADQHHAASDRLAKAWPMGQPILVGHHSEKRHRRDIARVHALDVKGWEARAVARYAEQRAEASRHAASGEVGRRYVENKVKSLRADIARDLRTLHGHWNRWGQTQTWTTDPTTGRDVLVFRPVDPDSDHGRDLAARITENTDQRTYWAAVLEDMGPAPVAQKPAKGDTVAIFMNYATGAKVETFTVVRAAKDTVTVDTGRTDDAGKPITQRHIRFNVERWTRADGTPGKGW